MKTPILPTSKSANIAARNGRLDILQWMATLTPPVYPTSGGARSAKRQGHIEVLDWLAHLDVPILPVREEILQSEEED